MFFFVSVMMAMLTSCVQEEVRTITPFSQEEILFVGEGVLTTMMLPQSWEMAELTELITVIRDGVQERVIDTVIRPYMTPYPDRLPVEVSFEGIVPKDAYHWSIFTGGETWMEIEEYELTLEGASIPLGGKQSFTCEAISTAGIKSHRMSFSLQPEDVGKSIAFVIKGYVDIPRLTRREAFWTQLRAYSASAPLGGEYQTPVVANWPDKKVEVKDLTLLGYK